MTTTRGQLWKALLKEHRGDLLAGLLCVAGTLTTVSSLWRVLQRPDQPAPVGLKAFVEVR